MASNEYPITLTTFPRLGTKDDYIQPYYPPSGAALRSQFVPDEIANPHIRFPTLAGNIRSRRGRKVELNVPVFKDTNTPEPFNDPTVNYDLHNWPEDDDVRNGAAKEGHVYMDAMAFGMGSCCLQITFQAKNMTEGRKLYDQLSPLGPILLALTAATPIYKGFLVDTDVRWNQIGNASRYASNSTYLSQDPRLRKEYLDPDLIVDEEIKKRLIDGGMDELLATHFAHLFIRDPLVIFSEDLEELDLNKADHFENLQSTNWQHMRFKPPPPEKDDIGWRVEFRSMEIQMTDFENAAFSIFIVLVTRAILSFDLNFYIPIQRTTENMETAHARNAVLDRKFYFRKDPFSPRARRPHPQSSTNGEVSSATSSAVNTPPPSPPLKPVESEYELMTISDIINGSADGSFPGLIPLVESYLNSVNVDVETRCFLATYLDLIRKRANGTLWTGARWIREYVASHPAYKHDSVVSEEICYDLVKAVEEMSVKEGKHGSVGWELLRGKNTKSSTPTWFTTPLIFDLNGAHTAAILPNSYTFTSGSQIRSSISSCTFAICSTKTPIVQKRGTIGGGGQSDIPPARMQYFSKSADDFAFNAARKPCMTVMMASSSGDGGEHIGVMGRGSGDNIVHHTLQIRLNNGYMTRG
ncbi:unnamed protein product [Aspergillus oryzae]|uniref:Glutamate--cysteine ligase n=2 Tax=Aspergillus oryzae TaxID=5062 RepID=A0AAN5BNH9_ASPOZ|nr:unnamed protein product [Aspergillus oryzae]GMF84920.1 unnamed protein product [Aspergillus oryzae]GMG24533.1 unnamed protein product [Aspergillus oryzae]GMG45886.1 unnamed protein product [Aspergillus oryzae var. brunneus]